MSWIKTFDDRVVQALHAAESPVLDRWLPLLGRAANHSRLWLGIAAALSLTGNRRARRAALRGLAAVAMASTTTNLVSKGLTGRARPTIEGVPLIRQLRRMPRTTSFPSGHSASAAAFATGVAMELPVAAAPVAVLAAAVAVSRIVAGAHHPSDVAAGMATGVAAGLVTTRWWPRRPPAPATAARPRHAAPALPTGAGLVLVVNSSAGLGQPDVADTVGGLLPDAEVRIAAADEDLGALLADAANRATVLGVAGGDGTVNLAARVAADRGLPLLVIPAGTLNHFARDVGVSSVDDAVSALVEGDAVAVDLGVAGDEVFLNTFSTGVYVDLVHARERLEDRIGK